MESGFIELKLDNSETKNEAGDDANNVISAVGHMYPRGSKPELSGDFLRRCCLDGGVDVSFLVGGYKFYAHRAVLAAGSPVFKDLLLGPTADDIRLHGIEPETFRVLLQFMYTSALPGDDEIEGGAWTADMLRNLVAAADAYGMERLKLTYAHKLSEHVSVETFVATLGLAETHKCPELKNRCLDFLVEGNNLRRAALSRSYGQLMQSFPSILYELRARFCPDLESSEDYMDFDLFF